MSGRRPLLNARVDQLEGLFQEKGHDVQTLRRLAAELLHRESSRANSLLLKIRASLDEAGTNSRRPEPEASEAPKHLERHARDRISRELSPYAGSASADLKRHVSDEASSSLSTTDVFGEDSPIDAVEERDALCLSSANSFVKREPFFLETGENPSRRTAGEGARWLHDVSELFGTSDLSLHTVMIFLRVAHADRLGQPLESHELAPIIGKTAATVSRNIGLLGERSKTHQPGMQLITAQPDNADRRRKPIRLTPKGRRLLRMIENL